MRLLVQAAFGARPVPRALVVLLLAGPLVLRPLATPLHAQEPVSIFNGRDLDGWTVHGTERWYVEDGELICESGPDAAYGYLRTDATYTDFELTLEFKQEADGNSGVFFRSTLDGVVIKGWQAEVAPPGLYTGGIYESYGRGWLAQPEPYKDDALRMGEWNEMTIRVVGSRVTTWLNGTEMIDLTDDRIGEATGHIALQIHDGGGIKLRWRNLRVTVPGSASGSAGSQSIEDRVRRILSETPLIDGHNDLPGVIGNLKTAQGDVGTYDLRGRAPGDTDLPRLRRGMVGGQFWSVHVDAAHPRPAMKQLEQIDIARRMIDAYPDVLDFAGSASDIERVFGSGKIASLLGIEGGHVIENSLGALRAFYTAGVRYMTLTHFSNTDWADSGTDEPVAHGLTAFGEEVVREMNRLGMMVDLAHTSPETMMDALDVSDAPVIFSHAAARGVADHPRNVPDDVLRRLAANGGVLMQLFYPPYLDIGVDSTATIADVADHIEHVRAVAGIDHVGLGSDFDGIPSYVEGMEDVSTFPALFMELARRGWSDGELRKLAGENILRVMRDVETVSARLRRERPPSTRTIEELDGPKRGADEPLPAASLLQLRE